LRVLFAREYASAAWVKLIGLYHSLEMQARPHPAGKEDKKSLDI